MLFEAIWGTCDVSFDNLIFNSSVLNAQLHMASTIYFLMLISLGLSWIGISTFREVD
jgi:hypothetical protein